MKKNSKKEKKETKKTLKNYIILLIIFAVGIGLTLYLCKWYKVIDEEKNNIRGEEVKLSTDSSKIDVYVIPTNEELMIAEDTYNLINK